MLELRYLMREITLYPIDLLYHRFLKNLDLDPNLHSRNRAASNLVSKINDRLLTDDQFSESTIPAASFNSSALILRV